MRARNNYTPWLLGVMALHSYAAQATEGSTVITEEVAINAPLIDSRIIKHPATVETYDRKQIAETVNAATTAQTLKYLPSIQVRERYIGDRNGIIASRTIGTLSSAQSMVYADGVLLSNLLGNSFAFPPRWGLVSPEEVESISMMYGPFSALYAGNSFGGVMSIATRMPEKFESHLSTQAFQQNFELYGTHENYSGQHATASAGDKVGDLSFRLGVDYLKNEGQPMSFSTSTTPSVAGGGTVISGAYQDKSETGTNRVIFGANSIDDTEQTNIKFKATYDITPRIKAAYTLGVWDLDSRTDIQSYIKDAAGNTVYNNRVRFNGRRYDVSGLSPAESEALHVMQALDLKSNTEGFFDWQLTLSDYDYQKDKNSSSNLATSTTTLALGNPYITKTGRVTDMTGTGWTVFDARTTLRPQDHTLDVGYHLDHYELQSTTHNTADWSVGDKGTLNASSRGETRTQALYAQDKWQIAPAWALTVGGRAEHWQAYDGRSQTTISNVLRTSNYDERSKTKFSPKLSLSFEPEPAWGFRAAVGQAFRFPTVNELYQALQNGASAYFVQSNPDLKPEEVISGELTAERRFANGLIRASLFHENKYDALISQTLAVGSAIPYDTGTCTRAAGCSFIQNIDHIRTRGIELATQWQDVLMHGLDLQANATLTDAEVLRNHADPSVEGNKPTRIPRSMFKAVATFHQGNNVTYSLAARYSGRQYNALNNSDSNPDTFGGASKFFIMDARATYHFAQRWTAALGIDNINNDKAYVFHPYPQRTGYLQLKFDY